MAPQAFFLVGPTAVGKSAVAHWLAERHGYEILSADSMQVYRGLDIGTAKPALCERRQFNYWGLDLVAWQEPFSVGEYHAAALRAVASAAAAQKHLLVVGGTGLYINSLLHGLAPRPPRNAALRARAERLLATQGIEALQAWLVRLDQARYQALADQRNPRRLIRALEVATAGRAVDAKTWPRASQAPRIPGLSLPPAELHAAIERRVHQMYAAGLVEEVRELGRQGLAAAPTAARAIGYAEVLAYLEGQCTRAEAIAATIGRTRRLAKRQLTWFRHQANVEWLQGSAQQPLAERAQAVLAYWRQHGPTPIAQASAELTSGE